MWQTLLTGLLLGFVTSSSCPSNAILIKTPKETPLSRLTFVGFGAVAGYAILLLVSLAWMVPLIRAAPGTIPLLELFGAFVFLYLSASLLKNRESFGGASTSTRSLPAKRRRHFIGGLAATALNPVNLAWWAAFLSPSLGRDGRIEPLYAVFILVGSLGWFTFFAAVLRFARSRWKERAQLVFRWAGAAVLAAFGFHFLLGSIGGLLGHL